VNRINLSRLLWLPNLVLVAALAACAGGGSGGDDSYAAPGGDAGNRDAAAAHDGASSHPSGSSSSGGSSSSSSGSFGDDASGDDASASDDGSGGGNDLACGQLSTLQACQQCCLGNHPAGYKIYASTLESCACTNPGACQSECATEYCVKKPTMGNDSCATCLSGSLMQGSGACYTPVATACQADLDCSTLFGSCIPQCMGKP
jgi:hypothetical protein